MLYSYHGTGQDSKRELHDNCCWLVLFLLSSLSYMYSDPDDPYHVMRQTKGRRGAFSMCVFVWLLLLLSLLSASHLNSDLDSDSLHRSKIQSMCLIGRLCAQRLG